MKHLQESLVQIQEQRLIEKSESTVVDARDFAIESLGEFFNILLCILFKKRSCYTYL